MLQGSLDNFALDEVLGLLSSTSKTGRLDLDGDRGTGSLTLRDGQLVDALASGVVHTDGPEDVLFELLRYATGTFTFAPLEVPAEAASRDVADVLDAAENRLADFRTIESVVPSLAHHLTPVETLPADEVTIGRREWAALRAIGVGGPVSVVCEALELNEIEGSRQVKGLVERGLVELTEPRPALVPGSRALPAPAPEHHHAGPAGHDDDGPAALIPHLAHDDGDPDLPPSVFSEPRPEPVGTGADHGDREREAGLVGLSTGPSAASGPAPVGLLPPVERPMVSPFIGDDDGHPLEDRRILGDDLPMFDTNPGESPARRASDGEGQGDEEDGRPGGLLMRYLKNDG